MTERLTIHPSVQELPAKLLLQELWANESERLSGVLVLIKTTDDEYEVSVSAGLDSSDIAAMSVLLNDEAKSALMGEEDDYEEYDE